MKKLILAGLLFIIWSCSAQQEGDIIYKSLKAALQDSGSVKILQLNTCQDLDINGLDKISSLIKLEELEISECPNVNRLPMSMEKLNRLKKLVFNWNGAFGIENWDTEFLKITQLENLEELTLGPYNNIIELSPEVQNLGKLKKLNLYMTDLQYLPKEIGRLVNLEVIDLSMTKVEKLPRELSELPRLQKVYLIDTPISKNKELLKSAKEVLTDDQIVLVGGNENAINR